MSELFSLQKKNMFSFLKKQYIFCDSIKLIKLDFFLNLHIDILCLLTYLPEGNYRLKTIIKMHTLIKKDFQKMCLGMYGQR
jgi:hypothetical protein